jgi:hypothetical protein
VPYRISAPENLSVANRTVVVEPPHGAAGLGALSVYLRRDFLFSRGFVHAGIGWSTLGTRILDPSVPDTFIEGGFRQFGANYRRRDHRGLRPRAGGRSQRLPRWSVQCNGGL